MAKEKANDPVTRYAKEVKSGKIPAGMSVKLACERHLKLLKTARKKGYTWDLKAAKKAIGFFPFLKHLDGEWVGCEFRLELWQQFIVGYVFGWKRADGTRLVRTALIEIPRKNGKTTMCAGIGLLLLVGDREAGARVYCAATKRDQAKEVHNPATEMVRRSPALSKRLKTPKLNINDPATFSKFEPLGADKNTLDGLNAHGMIIDELHAHKTRDVWDVLTTSTGSRRQPLIVAITTAGFGGKPTICREQHDYGERILKGIVEDDEYFVYIATIDEGDDWTDEKVWAKANPGLGTIKKWDAIRRDFKQAKENPAFQNTFRRNHLNEWTQQETRWMDLRKWDATAGMVKPEKLKGRLAYGGLDLANKIDIAAFALVFPPPLDKWDDGIWEALLYFWIPEEAMIERSQRDKVPYDLWVREGFIKATPGEVISYAQIREDILALTKRYKFLTLGYDPWFAEDTAQELELEGLEPIEVRPTAKNLNAPTKELMRLVLQKRMRHGGNPVLRWMADNLVVKHYPTDLIMPDKEKSAEKIDGMVALITALEVGMRLGKEDQDRIEEFFFA
ncbi:MAG: terminase TerL endonuclease subunit [Actinomycetota bacterium]|nr:terminase TerL endonuclease subunit [Actinomycetota bacterium]